VFGNQAEGLHAMEEGPVELQRGRCFSRFVTSPLAFIELNVNSRASPRLKFKKLCVHFIPLFIKA
jgi:hypothetical protein